MARRTQQRGSTQSPQPIPTHSHHPRRLAQSNCGRDLQGQRSPHRSSQLPPYFPTQHLIQTFAKIIHTRLQNALDDKLRETQYGFRATRSILPSLFTSSAASLKEQKRLDSRYTPSSSTGLRRSTKYTLTLFSQHWTASESQHISPHSSRTYTLHRSSRSLPQENLAPAKKHKQASAKAVHSHHTSSSSFTA